ncbi:hypothetical protein B0H14DRAFT_2646859 [Mycena olivaceomarginata]|nr:hypothetical protein B0H14DRAFT_2646859 [Mycena olivaceomarginata]
MNNLDPNTMFMFLSTMAQQLPLEAQPPSQPLLPQPPSQPLSHQLHSQLHNLEQPLPILPLPREPPLIPVIASPLLASSLRPEAIQILPQVFSHRPVAASHFSASPLWLSTCQQTLTCLGWPLEIVLALLIVQLAPRSLRPTIVGTRLSKPIFLLVLPWLLVVVAEAQPSLHPLYLLPKPQLPRFSRQITHLATNMFILKLMYIYPLPTEFCSAFGIQAFRVSNRIPR